MRIITINSSKICGEKCGKNFVAQTRNGSLKMYAFLQRLQLTVFPLLLKSVHRTLTNGFLAKSKYLFCAEIRTLVPWLMPSLFSTRSQEHILPLLSSFWCALSAGYSSRTGIESRLDPIFDPSLKILLVPSKIYLSDFF